MAITDHKLIAFAKIIANLGDKPNNTEFTAQSLKEYFDSSPEELRVKLNALIDAIVEEYATKTELQNMTLGQIPDNSVTDAKLSAGSGDILARFSEHITDNLSQQSINEILMNFNPVYIDNFDTDSRSKYTLSGCTLTAPVSGITRFASTTTDPMATLTASFPGGINRYIVFRYKVVTGTPSAGQILYTTGSHSVSNSYYKAIPALTADGEWHTALLDMHSLDAGGTDWKDNTITSVRFDFTESSGIDIDLDYISIGSIGYMPKAEIPQASAINIADTGNHFTSTNVEDTLSELFTFASDGKTGIASAVTAKGVSASSSDTFSTLATKIGQIPKGQGNAVETQVLAGATFSNSDGVLRTGTMPNKGDLAYTVTQQNEFTTYTIGGRVGNIYVQSDITNLTQANVKAGVTVGGVAGSFTSDGTAVESNILTGKRAYVNGMAVDGTMPNQAGATVSGTKFQTVNTSGYFGNRVPAGYYDSNSNVVIGDGNLKAENILAGKSIFGLAGSAKRMANGSSSVTFSGGTYNFAVSSLTFQPSMIVVYIGDVEVPGIVVFPDNSNIRWAVAIDDGGSGSIPYKNIGGVTKATNGFTVPLDATYVTGTYTVYWWAYE